MLENYKNDIAMFRRMRGYTQEYMAEKMGISRPTYIAIERGKKELTISQINEILEILGMKFNDLISIEKNEKIQVPAGIEKKRHEKVEVGAPETGTIIYQTDESGELKIDVKVEDETVWLTQAHLVRLYNTSKANISEHLKTIFETGELNETSTVRKFRTVATNGRTYNIRYYNLDVILALGYKINSEVAIHFRRWATERLKEYIVKGFTMDDERLKQNGGRYFKELLQRIRDIRSSERNLWQQVTDIYATSVDYNHDAKETKEFFATVQNKMHYAIHKQTAAEVVYNRVDSEKPMLGMTNFKGGYITREDTYIAKNYLNEKELRQLNLLVSQYLDFAEFQAEMQRPMTMKDWKERLDIQLRTFKLEILEGNGKISRKQARLKADTEYDKYRKKELENYESDFDRAVKELVKRTKKLNNG